MIITKHYTKSHVCQELNVLLLIDSTFVNLTGSSGYKLQELSAGAHCITFLFIPYINCSDDFSVRKEYQFEIGPTGNANINYTWKGINTYISVFLLSARAFVSVNEDTAAIKLYSNTEGEFKCSLDEAPFQTCMHVYCKSSL